MNNHATSIRNKLIISLSVILLPSINCVSQEKHDLQDTSLVKKFNSKAQSFVNNNLDSLKYYATKALTIAEHINDLKGASEASASMGDFYWLKGDLAKALEEFEISKNLAEKINNERLIAGALSGIAIIHRNLGNYTKAIELQIQLISLNEKSNNRRGSGLNYNLLGVAYKNNKMYGEALDAYKHAFSLLQKYGTPKDIPGVYANLGIVFMELKKYDSSLVFLKKALKLSDSLKIDRLKIVSLNSIGDLFSATGNQDSAFNYRKKAYQMSERLRMPVYKIDALTGMGNISKSRKNYRDAIDYYLNAIQIAKKSHLTSSLPRAYLGIAQAFAESGQLEKSNHYFKNYIDLTDSLFNTESIRKISDLRISHDVEKKEASIALLQKDAKIQELTRNIIVVIGTSLVLFLGLRFRRQQLINRKEKIILKAGYEKRLLEVRAMALRSQLNPHFLFNSMNSINSYILNSDIKEASSFLTKFSKLMRMILDNSDKATISLEDDLKLLRLYLEIEQKRTKGMFEFSIEASNHLDVKTIEIPSLLAQPFVENSIWHAFEFDKPGNLIKVIYTSDGDSLICKVSDNGVGRKKAAQEKSLETEHRSFGLKIGNDRLKVLSTDSSKSYIEIEDIVDEHHDGIGTQVTIRIPLKFLINSN